MHGCDPVEENVVFSGFGLQLCQRVLGTAHWNTKNNEALDARLKKNVPSPHDCSGIFTPGNLLQSMTTSGIDPTLVPDGCLALVQCDPRLVPQVGGQRVVDVYHSVWLRCHIEVVVKGEQVFAPAQLSGHGHQSSVLPQTEEEGHQGVSLFAPLALWDVVHNPELILHGVP